MVLHHRQTSERLPLEHDSFTQNRIGVDEVDCTFVWTEEADDLAGLSPRGFDRSGLGVAHEAFELGEARLDTATTL